jgi:L-threonylcarbamoyladenylate synthase
MTMSRTELVRIEADRPDEAIVDRAADLVSRGCLLVVPTETRYGLLTRADDKQSVQRLYGVKRRPMTVPTAVFLRNYGSIVGYGETNQMMDTLADAFLPGPLTLVTSATTGMGAPVVVAGKIGIRVSSAPFMASLMERVECPLTATSANISGEPEPRTAAEIKEILGEAVDLYVDVGILDGPVSTVVDCTQAEIRVLRQGSISTKSIREALARTVQ